MVIVNIHEAKTHLSKLIERVVNGETIVIAKAGKPLVTLSAIDAPKAPRRLGFLSGDISIPKDFDRIGEAEIGAMFGAHK